MKKLLIIILTAPVFCFGQKDSINSSKVFIELNGGLQFSLLKPRTNNVTYSPAIQGSLLLGYNISQKSSLGIGLSFKRQASSITVIDCKFCNWVRVNDDVNIKYKDIAIQLPLFYGRNMIIKKQPFHLRFTTGFGLNYEASQKQTGLNTKEVYQEKMKFQDYFDSNNISYFSNYFNILFGWNKKLNNNWLIKPSLETQYTLFDSRIYGGINLAIVKL